MKPVHEATLCGKLPGCQLASGSLLLGRWLVSHANTMVYEGIVLGYQGSLQFECLTLVEMRRSSPSDGQQPGLDTPGGKKLLSCSFFSLLTLGP